MMAALPLRSGSRYIGLRSRSRRRCCDDGGAKIGDKALELLFLGRAIRNA
jgi:hypothetical protein